jgi:hypothetical protein
VPPNLIGLALCAIQNEITFGNCYKPLGRGRVSPPLIALKVKPWRRILGASPQTPKFTAFRAKKEANKKEAEHRGLRLFPSRLRGARVALQRSPILPGDILMIRETFTKLNRTFHVL